MNKTMRGKNPRLFSRYCGKCGCTFKPFGKTQKLCERCMQNSYIISKIKQIEKSMSKRLAKSLGEIKEALAKLR